MSGAERPEALPSNWYWARLDEIATINPGLGNDLPDDDTPVSFVPMAYVEALTGNLDGSGVRPFGEVKRGYTRFRDHDVVFAKITPSMENGKIALAKHLINGIGCGTTELHVIRAEQAIVPRYLLHFLLQQNIRNLGQRNMTGTAGQMRVPEEFLAKLPVPVPPTVHQERIVTKLDELFSDIEAGEKALERARKLIGRYRQSVLKAAVTGELTRDWREKNLARLKAEKKTGADLLADILTKRREAWEAAELAKMRAKGQEPRDDRWKARYKEPAALNGSELADLPDGWVWATIEQCGDVQLGRQRAPKYHMSMNFSPEEFETFKLEPNDILLNEGQSLELVGRPAIYRGEVSGSRFTNTLVRFRAPFNVEPAYALMLFRSYLWSGRFQKIATITTNIAHLGAGRFAALEFPLPPHEEQIVIAEQALEKLTQADKQRDEIERCLKMAAAIRQSILSAAFSGSLVKQRPGDELASELLARIRADRDAKSTGPKAIAAMSKRIGS